jgi:signal transduction histidine kinase/ligand-binding sensor domain-containing protein
MLQIKSKMDRVKLCISIFLVAIPFSLFAQVAPGGLLKKCPVNTINYEQGLLNNEVVNVITDSLGFTWVSSILGLQRYNGYTLENINPVIGGDTLKIKKPVCFFNLQNGRLWISGKQGVLEYDPRANSFKKIVAVNSAPNDYYGLIPVRETPQGVWCVEHGRGLVLYTLTGKLISVDQTIGPAVVEKMFGRYEWIAATNKDFIFILDSQRKKIMEFSLSERRLVAVREVGTSILDITCSKNSVYVSTTAGVARYSIAGWKLLNTCSFKSNTAFALTFSHMCMVNDQRLIVSVNGDLFEYSADLSQRKTFTRIDGSPILLAGNAEQIYYDKFERIWIITNDDLKRIQDRDIPFAYLRYPAAANNFVRALYFDERKKQLLAGCFNGGLLLFDSLSNPVWKSPLVTDQVKDVLSIEKLNQDNYLVITWQKGWYLLNLPGRRLTKMILPKAMAPEILFNNSFSSNLQRINDSTLLVACSANVYKCIFKGDQLKVTYPMIPFVADGGAVSSFVYSASSGSLWVGCLNGTIFNQDKLGVISTMHLPDALLIRSMAEDADKNIWVGSNRGLYVYNPKGKRVADYFKSSGLLNDCIYSLLPLKSGSAVFAGSNLGLAYIGLNGVINNYTKDLGLQDNEFNTDAVCRTSDGKFYFGGISGISAFYPSSLTELMNKPILNVTRLIVNDSSYNSSAGIWKGDTIELQYNQNHLQFDFAAMGLLSADKYLYRYRIASFEKKWQSTYQPTGIRYTLSPGKYRMEVSCSNALSGQALNKYLTIIIHSPWWLTWWFLTIVAAAGVAIVIWTVSFYNKRKFQRELQELMIKQTIQVERERISRDLHDNLGAQANAIFYGTEQLKKHNGHEQNLVDELHDTAGDMLTVLRETLWAMRITQVGAAELWLRILNFAKKMGPYYSNLKIEISGSPPRVSLNASMALNLVLIVQEAVTNAIRHADPSVITISSFSSAHSWQIEIADDGKGFDTELADKKRESYGIENMKERANQSGIGFRINSLPGTGTKVFLDIEVTKMESQLN